MTISAVVNLIRSGKTLMMTLMGYYYYLHGATIYSNYEVNFKHEFVNSLEDLNKMKDGIFLWDDSYQWADSRKYKENEHINLIMAKSGKRYIDIIMSSTRVMQIDKNIRFNMDYVYKPFGRFIFYRVNGRMRKYPIYMELMKYRYDPSYEEEDRCLVKLVGKWNFDLNSLIAGMWLYDTHEEIEVFNKGRNRNNY